MRHTVGAAHRLVTGNRASVASTSAASKRPPAALLMKMVQPAIKGAYTLLHATHPWSVVAAMSRSRRRAAMR